MSGKVSLSTATSSLKKINSLLPPQESESSAPNQVTRDPKRASQSIRDDLKHLARFAKQMLLKLERGEYYDVTCDEDVDVSDGDEEEDADYDVINVSSEAVEASVDSNDGEESG